jgi:hypothetical protein
MATIEKTAGVGDSFWLEGVDGIHFVARSSDENVGG